MKYEAPWQLSIAMPGAWHWVYEGDLPALKWFLGSAVLTLVCPPIGVLVWVCCVLDARRKAAS
jgi:hypothetical protein